MNKILIIDDDLSIRKSMANYFEDRDFTVFTAENGQSGLDIFLNRDIDIVLTDLRMPGMDGLDVMKAIQAHTLDVPMVVVSGAGKEEDIIQALQIGAKDYITKPITDFNIILHTVERVLEIRRLNLENKAYRKKIEASEKQYRTITENIAEGVFTLDGDRRFTYANQAFLSMTGYSQEQLNQKTLEEIALPESRQRIEDDLMQFSDESGSRVELKLQSIDGKRLHVELACSSVMNEQNSDQGLIAVVRDITELAELRKKYKKYLSPEDKEQKDVVPICANCKKIKVEKGSWVKMETYFKSISFSHGICPDCCEKLYPGLDIQLDE